MTTRPLLGILGGMGPEAAVYFYQLILKKTAAKCDQDHLDVLHLSRSSDIADRTKFLLDENQNNPRRPNPSKGMFRNLSKIKTPKNLFQGLLMGIIPLMKNIQNLIGMVFQQFIYGIKNIK